MEVTPLPVTAGIEQYEQQAAQLLHAFISGDRTVVHFFCNYNKRLQNTDQAEFRATVSIDDARASILNWFRFEEWSQLEQWVAEVIKPGSTVLPFELAADALVTGDILTLQSLLAENAGLIDARSMRPHHAQLIHYTGSNGVEDYRQQCPANIVEVLQVLLNAGADINAEAGMYGGGSTPLGLASTSFHPSKAGVMTPLLAAMLKAGAIIDSPVAIQKGYYAVNACLHNGRPEAADFLVKSGARLDIEGAIGTGRLETVKTFFNEKGSLKDPSEKGKMEEGFMWACEFGHTEMVRFLLQHGLNIDVEVHGMFGLHWALIGGHVSIIQMLLDNKVSLSARNRYGGTSIGACLWAAANSQEIHRWPEMTMADYVQIMSMLLDAGAVIAPGTLTWVLQDENFAKRLQIRDAIAELLRKHGAVT